MKTCPGKETISISSKKEANDCSDKLLSRLGEIRSELLNSTAATPLLTPYGGGGTVKRCGGMATGGAGTCIPA